MHRAITAQRTHGRGFVAAAAVAAVLSLAADGWAQGANTQVQDCLRAVAGGADPQTVDDCRSVAAAVAPGTDRREIVPFLQGTYVFLTAPRAGINFEADIQPNLVISQNFSDTLITDETLQGKRRKAFSVVGTPRVRLRELLDDSKPVRTPSYMPKGTLTLFFVSGTRQGAAARKARADILSPQVTVGHHSNGQDGCLFTTDDATCNGTPDVTKINTHDGSFSTNYVRLGFRWRREWLRRTSTDLEEVFGFEEQTGTAAITIGVDYDRHFHTDPRVKPYYEQNRGNATFGAAVHLQHVCRSRASATATLFYVGQLSTPSEPLAFQAEGSCTFSDQGGWGVFLRYYTGQDYYNLAWALPPINRAMFGVVYDQDGFLRFVSRRAKAAAAERARAREAR